MQKVSLQRLIAWLLGLPEHQPELSCETPGSEVAPIAIDVPIVTSVLKSRRLRRRRTIFRGFKSPPGRF